MPWQRSLMDQKINFRLIIYDHSSTNPEYLAMIGRMHLGLTNIIKKKKKQQQNTQIAIPAAVLQQGGLAKPHHEQASCAWAIEVQ